MELYLNPPFIKITQNYIRWLNVEKKIKFVINLIKKIIRAMIILFYLIFLVAMIIGGAISGAMTLLPDKASKPCYLGYYAHCSFTPFSTIILFSMAIVGIILLIFLIRYLRRK